MLKPKLLALSESTDDLAAPLYPLRIFSGQWCRSRPVTDDAELVAVEFAQVRAAKSAAMPGELYFQEPNSSDGVSKLSQIRSWLRVTAQTDESESSRIGIGRVMRAPHRKRAPSCW